MHISLLGMYSSRNFGDILMLDFVKSWIEERYPDATIGTPFGVESVVQDAGLKGGGGTADLLRSDAVVYAGGGGFGLPPNPTLRKDLYMVRRNLMPCYQAIRRGVPFIAIGIGAGPFGPLSKRLVRRIVHGASGFAVRERVSADHLERAGISASQFIVTADIAATITREKIGLDPKRNSIVSDLHIGVHMPGGQNMEQKLAIARSIREVGAKRKEITWHLFTDHPGSVTVESLPQYAAILEGLGDQCKVGTYSGHRTLLTEIGQLDGIITTKLHVGICATGLGVPVASFAEHGKTARYYDQIQKGEWSTGLATVDVDAAQAQVERLLQSSAGHGEIVPQEVRDAAWRNRTLLNHHLERVGFVPRA